MQHSDCDDGRSSTRPSGVSAYSCSGVDSVTGPPARRRISCTAACIVSGSRRSASCQAAGNPVTAAVNALSIRIPPFFLYKPYLVYTYATACPDRTKKSAPG